MSASYAASLKTLRYEIDKADAGNTVLAKRATTQFKIGNCSFPQMPNMFCFVCQPSYQHKINHIGFHDVNGNSSGMLCRASKLDSQPCIVDLRLQINTSSNCWPQVGNVDLSQANVHNFRFSARQLYDYYLKNTSYDESLYDYATWFNHGCVVLLTPQDLNGVLNSPSVQGLVTMSAELTVYNTLKTGIYVGRGQPPAAQAGGQADTNYATLANERLEKYTCCVIGYYANQYITFDAKAAQVGNQTMSASFGAGLRLA
jgi:hypothetical protein